MTPGTCFSTLTLRSPGLADHTSVTLGGKKSLTSFLVPSPPHPRIHPPKPELTGVHRDQDLIPSHVCIKTSS